MKESTIIHIPHSSRLIPSKYRNQFVLNDIQLEKELNLMTDGYTNELFSFGYQQLVYPVSRLVCDPERFRNDSDESMAKIGMGAVYLKSSGLTALRRNISTEERESILEEYYDPHHSLLTELTDFSLEKYGRCLIIDGHSFSNEPLPYEPCQDNNRPNFCIGTESFHTPRKMANNAICFLQEHGYTVSENAPYSGAITPLKHYHKNQNVCSIMIEVNRNLYLNQDFLPNERFYHIRTILFSLIETISDLD